MWPEGRLGNLLLVMVANCVLELVLTHVQHASRQPIGETLQKKNKKMYK